MYYKFYNSTRVEISGCKNVKEDLKTKKTRKPLVLRKLSEQFFFEIENRTYYFDRNSEEAKELEKLQKSDVLALYKVSLIVD